MADEKLGGRLGGRLGYEPVNVYQAPFARSIGNQLSQSHDRLLQQMEAEAAAMQQPMSAGQQSQLDQAMDKMRQEMQGGGDEVSLSEAPWKGPLDPEGEVY